MRIVLESLQKVLLVVGAVMLALPSATLACSCFMPETPKFLSGPILPSNAKGVVYFRDYPQAAARNRDFNQVALDDLGKPPELKDFKMTDLITGEDVPLRIKALTTPSVAESLFPTRYYRSLSGRFDQCEEDRKSALCEPYLRLRFEDNVDWLQILKEKGSVEDITEKIHQNYGLFRIEPIKGFVAGRRYEIVYKEGGKPSRKSLLAKFNGDPDPNALAFTVEKTELLKEDFSVVLKELTVQNDAKVSMYDSGMCSVTITSDRIDVESTLSEALQPYKDSILMFGLIKSVSSSGGYRRWRYSGGACIPNYLGVSDVGRGKDLLHASCTARGWGRRGLSFNNPYEYKMAFALFEVFDSLEFTEVQPFEFQVGERSCGENVRKSIFLGLPSP